MCLNGIQNILENELGAKCTNFIFLSEETIFLLRNEKNPFLTFKPIYFVKLFSILMKLEMIYSLQHSDALKFN